MKESVIYQEILLEGEIKGEIKGKAEGLAKGKAEERNQIALKMLRSGVSVDLIAEFTGLTLKQIEKLQELSTRQPKNTKSPKAKKSSTL